MTRTGRRARGSSDAEQGVRPCHSHGQLGRERELPSMSRSPEPQTIVDCKDAAESVGLSYASTDEPGIIRQRAGNGLYSQYEY